MLKFNSVSKKPYLPEISFEFSDGVMCLVTDKSSTEDAFFAVLLGETHPDEGCVQNSFGGVALCNGKLPPEIKVRDYLSFVLRAKKCTELARYSAELTDSLTDKYIGSLSAFEQLKVSVAAALIGEPELMLLHTPASGLEFHDIKRLGALIDRLREFTSIILSCNIPSLFKEYTDKLLVITEGKAAGFGNTEDIIEKSQTEGKLYARIKGDIDAASGLLGERYTLEPSEKNGIFTVRCTDGEDIRKELRSVVRKLGMALLELKADNDSLKELFGSLHEAEDEAAATQAELDDDEAEESSLFTESSDESEPSDGEHSEATAHRSKLTISFAHSEDDDEEEE